MSVVDSLELLYQSKAQDSPLSVESFQYWLAIIAKFLMENYYRQSVLRDVILCDSTTASPTLGF